MYLEQWRDTKLHIIITNNPSKTVAECLEICIDTIQKIHNGLHGDSLYGTERGLAEGLINACQGVRECGSVLGKAVTTFETTCSDLRNAVGTAVPIQATDQEREVKQYHSSHGNCDYGNGDYGNDQYWTDRRFRGGKNQGGFTPQGGLRSRGRDDHRRGFNDFRNRDEKKYIICFKRGC
jgi:hypothetical protein